MSKSGDTSTIPEPKILRYAPDQFFRDGVRQIDFILAYDQTKGTDKPYFRAYREFFHRKLQEQGLELERETNVTTSEQEICFVKIHAPFEILAKFAEATQMKIPLKNVEKPEFSEETWPEKLFKISWFRLSEEYRSLYEIHANYSAVYRRDKQSLFQPFNDKSFFAPDERIQIVWYILCRTQSIPDGPWTATNSGVKRLMEKNVYVAVYPIHDGGKCYKCDKVKCQPISIWNTRRLLHRFWQSGHERLKHQPMVLIRSYFGLTISFYFSWLGCYTRALIPPSLFGIVCFVYGLIAINTNPIREEVCHDVNITMCPNCPRGTCVTWNLNESCIFYSLTLVCANEMTIPYAIFITLWTAWFLVYWKRKETELKYDSQESDVGANEEPLRIEYEEKATEKIQNPVTHRQEPHVRTAVIFFRRSVSVVVTISMIMLLVFAMFTLVFIRVTVFKELDKWLKTFKIGEYNIHQHFRLLSLVISATISLIVILVAENVYKKIARRLTHFELPKTMTQYETSFIYKMITFQFINYYMPLIYIAFMKGRMHSEPVIPDRGFFTVEDCAIAGCMSEIAILLIFTMCIRQFLSMIKEVCFPRLIKTVRKTKKFMWKTQKKNQWEKDFALVPVPELPLVEEYIEMIIQFGFVALFSVGFPLSAFFAFINNLFEIRSDAKKWTYVFRRPVPELAYDIGPWYQIIKSIAVFSILTNGCIVAFTSEIIPRLVYEYNYKNGSYFTHSLSTYDLRENKSDPPNFCSYYDYRESFEPYNKTIVWWHVIAARLAFLVAFFVLVHVFQRAIINFTPSVPESLDLHMRREQYVAWKMFYDTESRAVTDLNIPNNESEKSISYSPTQYSPPKVATDDTKTL